MNIETGKKYKLVLKNNSYYSDSSDVIEINGQIVRVVGKCFNGDCDIEDINGQWHVCESTDLEEI